MVFSQKKTKKKDKKLKRACESGKAEVLPIWQFWDVKPVPDGRLDGARRQQNSVWLQREYEHKIFYGIPWKIILYFLMGENTECSESLEGKEPDMLQKKKSAKSYLATFPFSSQCPPKMTQRTTDVAANSNNWDSADIWEKGVRTPAVCFLCKGSPNIAIKMPSSSLKWSVFL